MWVFAVNFFVDPNGAGKEFARGAVDGIVEKVSFGVLNFVDSAAFITSFIGMFLYMLGIKKGGQITGVSLAVWFTIRAVMYSL